MSDIHTDSDISTVYSAKSNSRNHVIYYAFRICNYKAENKNLPYFYFSADFYGLYNLLVSNLSISESAFCAAPII